ncbi:MAG: hypothetical protein AAGI08_12045 [Bacteroidota bacterium]
MVIGEHYTNVKHERRGWEARAVESADGDEENGDMGHLQQNVIRALGGRLRGIGCDCD